MAKDYGDNYRIETDSMGEVKVPIEKYWGAQTMRSLENFKIGWQMPDEIIKAFAILKSAAAKVNVQLGVLDTERAEAISKACADIMEGKLEGNFPLVVFQTGSGTQTNMNVNEVVAGRANEILRSLASGNGDRTDKIPAAVQIHPNDHVNKSQSSNDTFPTAMHIASVKILEEALLPALDEIIDTFLELEGRYMDIVKVGRTHLQDAAPLTLGQEISGWRSALEHNYNMIESSMNGLRELALGGTAVGTGLNAPAEFDIAVAEEISRLTGYEFQTEENKFHGLTSKDALVFSHGALKALAANLMKIAGDVRLLASGPRCGIGEIFIPQNEPGSSIMPGKVNPTQCEAVTMVCVQVMGNDAAIGFAASQGHYQLNVFMPVIIDNYLKSVKLLAEAIHSFNRHCLVGLEPNVEKIKENLDKSLMLVTALNPHIGYDKSAEVAKKAYREGISLKEAAVDLDYVSAEDFDRWVDPKKMVNR